MVTVKSQVHVNIPNSSEIRRDLLTSAVISLESLQYYENLKNLRQTKAIEISHFKSIMTEIYNLVKDVELNELPEYASKFHSNKIVKKMIKPSIQDTVKKPIKVIPVKKSQLESEIDDIRKKLGQLEI